MTGGYIVRLEPGVWLCPEDDDSMGRTLQRRWAAVYPSEGEAQSALAAARRHRAFQGAVIERVGKDVGHWQVRGNATTNERAHDETKCDGLVDDHPQSSGGSI